jgi:hypothetical protein
MYEGLFPGSHLATITLRLLRVKPVPGPVTTLIFLPSFLTVRQTTGFWNGFPVGSSGRLDHGLWYTETP